jgi:hypothetical protein
VQQTNARVPNSAADIEVFDIWPGRSGPDASVAEARERKVPSKISYSKTPNRERQWGFSIDEYSTTLEWTKMELMPHSPAKQLANLRTLFNGLSILNGLQQRNDLESEIPKHLVMNATEIIEDYLYRVAVEWHAYMARKGSGTLPNIDLDIVVTHPTVGGSPFLPSAHCTRCGTTTRSMPPSKR